MRKRTIIGGFIITLIAIYPITSNYHGTKLHEYLDQRVATLNQYLSNRLGIKYSVEAKLKKSGIFSSQYVFSIKDPSGKAIPLFNQDIEHGPFPLSNLKQGIFTPTSYTGRITLIHNDTTKQIFAAAKDKQPLFIEYTLGYNQQIKGHADFATFNFSYTLPHTQDTISSNIGTSNLTFSTDNGFKNVQLNIFTEPIIITLSQPQQKTTLKQGKTISQLSRKITDNDTVYSALSQINGLSVITNNQPFLEFSNLHLLFSIDDHNKTMDINANESYKDIHINGINFGHLDNARYYRHLNSTAVQQLGSIAEQVLTNLLKYSLSPSNTSTLNRKNSIEKLLESYKFSLGVAALNLFSHRPEIQYGPIVLTNTAGKSEVNATVGLLLPQLHGTDPEQIILSSISNADINITLNGPWLTQFLLDTATSLAKKNHLAPPTDKDKQQLKKIVDDLKWALTSSELATIRVNDSDNIRFSFQATKAGQSIMKTHNIMYNGQKYSSSEILGLLSERVEKTSEHIKDLEIANAITEFMQQFIKNPH